MIRTAARLARGLRAELLAATLSDRRLLSALRSSALAANQQPAEALGATIYTVPGKDVVDALLRFACDRGVTQVVLGQNVRRRLDILLRGPRINRFLRDSRNVDLYVVADRTFSTRRSQVPRAPAAQRLDLRLARLGHNARRTEPTVVL